MRLSLCRLAWVAPLVVSLPLARAAAAATAAEKAYEAARRQYFVLKEDPSRQNRRDHWLAVIRAFTTVGDIHTKSPEAAQARYTAAELWADLYAISRRPGDLQGALAAYREVVRHHGRSSLADDALYERAKLAWSTGRGEEALGDLEALLSRYPGGDRVAAARALVARARPAAGSEPVRTGTGTTASRLGQAARERGPGPATDESVAPDPVDLAKLIAAGLRDGGGRNSAASAPAASREVPAGESDCPSGSKRVVLDPGHGGEDSGAVGPGGVREKDVVLAIAAAARVRLLVGGVCVTLTRSRDAFVPLGERTRVANEAGADAFVSIHANSHRDRQADGVETYTLNLGSSRYERRLAAVENQAGARGDLGLILTDLANKASAPESEQLAISVQRNVVAAARAVRPKTRDLGVKSALFFVLVGARMPAILVETAFVSNPEEARWLGQRTHQERLGQALADGILATLRNPQVARVP